MNKFQQAIVDLFLEKVEKTDERDKNSRFPSEYYSKHVSTSAIADKLNITNAQARRELKKLEAQGLVEADRRYNNWTQWCTQVPGFKQHKYTDYYCRD